jgi:hypothetical protein
LAQYETRSLAVQALHMKSMNDQKVSIIQQLKFWQNGMIPPPNPSKTACNKPFAWKSCVCYASISNSVFCETLLVPEQSSQCFGSFAASLCSAP